MPTKCCCSLYERLIRVIFALTTDVCLLDWSDAGWHETRAISRHLLTAHTLTCIRIPYSYIMLHKYVLYVPNSVLYSPIGDASQKLAVGQTDIACSIVGSSNIGLYRVRGKQNVSRHFFGWHRPIIITSIRARIGIRVSEISISRLIWLSLYFLSSSKYNQALRSSYIQRSLCGRCIRANLGGFMVQQPQ